MRNITDETRIGQISESVDIYNTEKVYDIVLSYQKHYSIIYDGYLEQFNDIILIKNRSFSRWYSIENRSRSYLRVYMLF